MVEDYGKLLDKQDFERGNVEEKEHDEFYYQSSEKLGIRFLGKIVTEQRKKKSTLLTGPQAKNPNDIAPFLYFHNTLSFQICPNCPQAKNPSLLKPFLERGLASVYMLGTFSDTPLEFQKLAIEFPNYFIGPYSYYQYRYFSLNTDPVHTSQDLHDHYCAECIKEKIQPHLVNKDGLEVETRKKIDHIEFLISTNPIPAADKLTDLYIDTLKNPDKNSILELSNTANLMLHLSASNTLNCIPQINTEFLDSLALFTNPLQIHHNPNTDLGHYLDLIKDFKSILSPELISKNSNEILRLVLEINEEVDKISSSKRLHLQNFLSTFVLDVPLILAEVIAGGTYGFESSYRFALKNFKPPRLSQIKSDILSKYFGVSKLGIQVWQIKKQLEKN